MAGPALRQLCAHRSIHQAAGDEVEELVAVAERARETGRDDVFEQAADAFLMVAESRILVHASDEEASLYPDWLKAHPEERPIVEVLVAQHAGLRGHVAGVEASMQAGRFDEALHGMRAFVRLQRQHAEDEERWIEGWGRG
jgi:hypothetical protein